ncbi:hypothetical protein EJF36_01665 [Bacillus sp. HMF5848]|uniref:DUF6407 family protein n=1 Tax=Bacillus sp. HMF5848 TaxID=2495421 RepID=UPI000F76C627|nr:DUF6407 family protein [Bacillus sp. HMF5848]RSK25708.1 hypothetical protein EJF36_01665 [Bacillus sp. HMF5848]
MNSNLKDFVKNTIDKMGYFNNTNEECIKEIVTSAINYYQLKTYVEHEETELGIKDFLHINSIVEETLLSKIIEISSVSDNCGIEDIYEGRVIRQY